MVMVARYLLRHSDRQNVSQGTRRRNRITLIAFQIPMLAMVYMSPTSGMPLAQLGEYEQI
jgi:hypothetical protein